MIACMDFETTGLPLHPSAKPEKQPRATELCIIEIDEDGNQRTAFNSLFHPGRPIPAEIVKLTGITDEMVSDAPAFAECIDEIQEVFSRQSAILAHNMPFDGFILAHELRLAKHVVFQWPPVMMCTAQEYKELLGYRPKLKDLYEEILGRKYPQTHRAYDDCKALAEICVAESFHEFPGPDGKFEAGENDFIPPEFQ